MHFKTLTISQWQQFDKVEIDFHDRLTILTGANGCGKTTILNLLAKHQGGWGIPQLATPKEEKGTGIIKWMSRLFRGEDKSSETTIGALKYSNTHSAQLTIPSSPGATYDVSIVSQMGIHCFFIPSHRSIFRYQAVSNIPTTKKDRASAFQESNNSMRNRYRGGGGEPSSYHMKNTLISWVIHGYGVRRGTKSVMPPDAEQVRHFEGFESVLKKLLPRSLGFEELEVRNMEIVFVCNGGKDEFVLETCSGGISTLIDIAWQIYMFSTKEHGEFTVLIDEVENHLHPTLQRRILPDLVEAFPDARFVVSTHSPLIVSSVKESQLYALRYNSVGKIQSVHLDLRHSPKTAAEILDEVLGVSFTMPIWVEEQLNQISKRFADMPVDAQYFRKLRNELESIGMGRLLPIAMESVLSQRHD